jgi:hypothetical protein
MNLRTRCAKEHQPTEIKLARGWGKAMTIAYKMTKELSNKEIYKKDKDRTS